MSILEGLPAFSELVSSWIEEGAGEYSDVVTAEGGGVLRMTFSSTCLSSLSYDRSTSTLTLDFVGGRGQGSYDYPNVPEDIVRGFETAPSAGRYYHSAIKGQYG